MQNLEFDTLEPTRVPVRIGTTKYILQEADEDTATKFRNLATKGMTMQDGKMSFGSGLGDMEPFLVSRCLWELNEDGSIRRQAPEQLVRSWPSRVVKPIFDEAKRISLLDEQESPERKAVLALMKVECVPAARETITLLSNIAQSLAEQDSKLYMPLVNLFAPSKEEKEKNS